MGIAKIVLPAFGVCSLFLILGERSASREELLLRSLGGEVRAGEQRIEPEGEPLALARGSSLSTGPDARARLDTEGGSLVVEPATAVMIERTHPLRVRLFEGTLIAAGDVVITSAERVIELHEARSVVRIDAQALTIENAAGACRSIDPRGETRVGAGESARFEIARVSR